MGIGSNFKAEIVTLRECLAENHFIPDMQRQYEWSVDTGPKHVRNLWDSLVEFDENDPSHEDEYYTGTLICYKEGNKWSVIDGQQRITTLSVLFIAIRDALGENHALHREARYVVNGEEMALGKIVNLIVRETIGTSKRPRLMPKDVESKTGAKNSKAFIWHLNKIPRPEAKFGIDGPNCPFKINQAYRMFSNEIRSKFDLTSNEGVRGLIRFYEHILGGIVFNRTEVRDMAQGYRIFSSENTTGLNLNHMDITRALLLGQIDRRKLKSSTDKVVWHLKRMSRTMDSQSSATKNKFIRTVWVINNGVPMAKTKLLNSINSDIKKLNNDEKITSFSKDLSRWARFYQEQVLNPMESRSHYRKHRDLMQCNFQQHYPLLLSLLLRKESENEEDEINEILSIVESIYVRYILVGGVTPNTFEHMFANWANEAKDVSTLDKLVAKMKAQIADVEDPADFVDRFAEISPKDGVATYLLSRIEREKNERISVISDFRKAKTVPIFPKVGTYSILGDEWKEMCDPQTYVSGIATKIGNKFLIQEERTKMYPRSGTFAEQRRKLLENSGKFDFSKSSIEDLESFYPSQINDRGGELAEIADGIWKIFG